MGLVNKKTIFICPYFGQLPEYINFTLKSMAYNKKYNWLILTDQTNILNYKADNITIIESNLQNIEQLINLTLKQNLKIHKPYKLCDYKPLYGTIFSNYIVDYDYWGFCDLDVIYGDIDHFYRDILDTYNYDIITCAKNRIAGCFCIIKNIPRINNIYQKIYNIYTMLANHNRVAVDDDPKKFYSVLINNQIRIYDQIILNPIIKLRFDTVWNKGKLYEADNNEALLVHLFRDYVKKFDIKVDQNKCVTYINKK